MVKLAAFDFDGTIADTVPICIEAFGKAVSPYAGHSLTKDEIFQTFGLNETGMVKIFAKDNWEQALSDFYVKFEELHDMCNVPFEGIVPLIKSLKSKGVLVALVTGKGQKGCEIALKKINMQNIFCDIMTGSEHKNCKHESIIALMEKYTLSPQECIYVGDAVSDVTASNKAGIQCLSAAWCESADKEALYKVNGKNVYESVSELAEALFSLI